jgi:hypothetical protein
LRVSRFTFRSICIILNISQYLSSRCFISFPACEELDNQYLETITNCTMTNLLDWEYCLEGCFDAVEGYVSEANAADCEVDSRIIEIFSVYSVICASELRLLLLFICLVILYLLIAMPSTMPILTQLLPLSHSLTHSLHSLTIQERKSGSFPPTKALLQPTQATASFLSTQVSHYAPIVMDGDLFALKMAGQRLHW